MLGLAPHLHAAPHFLIQQRQQHQSVTTVSVDINMTSKPRRAVVGKTLVSPFESQAGLAID